MPSPARRTFQRARGEAEKTSRREAILAAASAHLKADGFDGFSMNALARKAGIAKGTLYLYFETREEVLLSLHSEYLAAWCAAVTRSTRKGISDATFVRRLLESSQAEPMFLSLASRLGSVLEQNVSVERLVESKRRMREVLMPLAAHFESCLSLPEGAGVRVLASLTTLILGAWQIDAGPKLEDGEVPADVREMMRMFSCGALFTDAAMAVLAGVRAEAGQAGRRNGGDRGRGDQSSA